MCSLDDEICRHCASIGLVIEFIPPHLELRCLTCRKFQRHLKRTAANLLLVGLDGVRPRPVDEPKPAVQPIALSDEQRAAADAILENVVVKKRVQTLGGYAGTGKTTVAKYLVETLKDWGVVAFTGKAADVLRRKGLSGAATIHSTIYRKPTEDEGRLLFVLRGRHEMPHCGFLVDEASMVGPELFDDLQSFKLPIIAIGDHGQLPPVGADAGLMLCPDYTLETVHRNAGPIARFAEHLRYGHDARDWKSGGGVYLASKNEIEDKTLLGADQIICAYNRTRVKLNRRIRTLLERPDDPVVGDKVICLRNDRSVGVFNGQQGVIEEIDTEELRLSFKPSFCDQPVWVGYHKKSWNAEKTPAYERGRPGENIPFDFSYCITAHKSQGDEWGKVLVFEEKCDLWEHSRWAYTAASRAKDALVWVTS